MSSFDEEQKEIGSKLEDIHSKILEKTSLLVNISFVIAGAYALVLAAIFFQSQQIPIPSNSTAFIYALHGTHLLYPLVGILLFIVSVGFLILGFGILMDTFDAVHEQYKNKFNKNNNISANLTPTNTIQVKKDYYIQFKSGNDLIDRNNKLQKTTETLIQTNNEAECFIIYSIILFCAGFTLIKESPISVFLFGLVIIMIRKYVLYRRNKRNK